MFRTDPRLALFTEESLYAIEMAAIRAGQYGDHDIDTLAAIYGLASLSEGVAPAALKQLGVTPIVLEGIYQDIYFHVKRRSRPVEELDFHPDLKKSVIRALEIAEGFESHFVGDEHLLLAISELRSTVGMRQLLRLRIGPEKLAGQVCACIESLTTAAA